MTGEIEALRRRWAGHVPSLLGAAGRYAVLCPLLEGPDGPELLFEVRAAGIRQGGEVCFPGGRAEEDEGAVACALRETAEELSIPRERIEILGELDFLWDQRRRLLRPVLGVVDPQGIREMVPSPAEVAETFTVPLSFFRGTPPSVWRYDLVPRVPEGFPYETVGIPRDYPWAPGQVEVPLWSWEGPDGRRHAVWGMTARIVRSLL